MTSGGVQADHFAKLVRQWSHLGPPLRPSPFDTAVVQSVITGLAPAARAVVLGLTPETISCRWPGGTKLLALDHSAAMVKALWPPTGAPEHAIVALADWRAMPVASATLDLVFGDACHALLLYPHAFAALTAEVARVLKPSGRYVVRVFIRPDLPQPQGTIAQALAAGHIGSVHALKLRLLGALHGKTGAGTCLGDVWQAWAELPPLPVRLRGQPGWTADEVSGIDAYRGLATRYYLPTLAELRAIHTPVFAELACEFGGYEMADHTPTLVLRLRQNAPDV